MRLRWLRSSADQRVWPLPLEKNIPRSGDVAWSIIHNPAVNRPGLDQKNIRSKTIKLCGINELRSFDRACSVQNIETKQLTG